MAAPSPIIPPPSLGYPADRAARLDGSRPGNWGLGWGGGPAGASDRLEDSLDPGAESGRDVWRRGGSGGDTLGASSLQMGDMLDPETDMLGDVAGELVENWK